MSETITHDLDYYINYVSEAQPGLPAEKIYEYARELFEAFTRHAQDTPPAPPCPEWCEYHEDHARHGYDSATAADPTVHSRIHEMSYGAPSVCQEEQNKDGVVTMLPPYIALYSDVDELDAGGARRIAAELISAAHKLDELR